MLDQFKEIEQNFIEIERRISDPEVISNQTLYQELLKKHSDLKQSVEWFRDYEKADAELADLSDLLKDPEMKEMAEEEKKILDKTIESLKSKLQVSLIPPDPNDHKNAIVEIRSGTGGEEAALFAYELYRMYTRYADSKGWKIEAISENLTGLGGIKEIVFSVNGQGVFSRLKFESGTHRVQRVPETETSGRLHTSAATVAILAEAEVIDIEIDTKDLRVDTYRASGAGGQHVNKTDSAVRLTHIPTGVVVACQDERSQFQNKEKAMKLLRSRLLEKSIEDSQKESSSARKLQVGSGDRSQKIRTYNYPQNRITDHRINFTIHELDKILSGDLDRIVDEMISADQLEKMKK